MASIEALSSDQRVMASLLCAHGEFLKHFVTFAEKDAAPAAERCLNDFLCESEI
jgi:hypothetical protein